MIYNYKVRLEFNSSDNTPNDELLMFLFFIKNQDIKNQRNDEALSLWHLDLKSNMLLKRYMFITPGDLWRHCGGLGKEILMPYPINQRAHQFNSIQFVPISFGLWDTALKFISQEPAVDVTDHLAASSEKKKTVCVHTVKLFSVCV